LKNLAKFDACRFLERSCFEQVENKSALYGQQSLVETAIGIKILDQMTNLAKPISVKVG